ncbi:MAG: cytidylyltransferase domain-containing protein [Actinomycetes bacterium]
MTTVAVIPARGGSKGVPGKNLATVGGLSLVAHTVLAAREAASIELVVVSTDEPAIAKEAARVGATVITRPSTISGDESSSEDAVRHAVDTLYADGLTPWFVALLQCTTTSTTGAHIDAVLEPVLTGTADSAFSAAPFHGFLWSATADGSEGVNHDASLPRARRQDVSPQLLENGGVYAFTVGGLWRTGTRFHGRVEGVAVDVPHLPEIDTPEDLALVRAAAGLVERRLPAHLSPPRLLLLDFDGVFTDNRVVVDQDGREAVICHRGDGHGLARLREHVRIVVLSSEVNPVVGARCAKLGLECVQGLRDAKAEALHRLAVESSVPLDDVWFVGNDVNDLECMAAAGTSVAVADAAREALAACDLVLRRDGGNGALRELCDLLLPLYAPAGGDTATTPTPDPDSLVSPEGNSIWHRQPSMPSGSATRSSDQVTRSASSQRSESTTTVTSPSPSS